MSKIISITNQKGGVGKTTTAINLGAALGIEGKKTLIIDIDPQGNSYTGLGYNKEEDEVGIYEVLINKKNIKEVIKKTEYKNLYITPVNINLTGAQVELLEFEDREFILKNKIKEIKNAFDYILIDCPPSLGILTINALCASNSIIIPIQCEFFALEGLSQLLQTIKRVRETINPEIEIEGVLLTMYDPRTNLSNQVVENVLEYFKDKVYKVIIPRNVRLGEAPSFGKPIMYYDKESSGAKGYLKLAKELIENG